MYSLIKDLLPVYYWNEWTHMWDFFQFLLKFRPGFSFVYYNSSIVINLVRTNDFKNAYKNLIKVR